MKMGKITVGVLCLVLLSACGSATEKNKDLSQIGCSPSGSPLGGGSGKENDPYLVCSVAHLKAMANSFTQDYFVLTSDLDLSRERDSLGTAVTGKFDGRGHTLRNFIVTSEMGRANGVLFAQLFSPTAFVPEIRNLHLENFQIEGKKLRLVATLLGANYSGKVVNVHATGSVSGEEVIGGLVAKNYGIIQDSSFTGTVQGKTVIGGIAGSSEQSFIKNCQVRGQIIGEAAVGGVVGESDKSTELIDNRVDAQVKGQVDFGEMVGRKKN